MVRQAIRTEVMCKNITSFFTSKSRAKNGPFPGFLKKNHPLNTDFNVLFYREIIQKNGCKCLSFCRMISKINGLHIKNHWNSACLSTTLAMLS
jgi:hypothetical protein